MDLNGLTIADLCMAALVGGLIVALVVAMYVSHLVKYRPQRFKDRSGKKGCYENEEEYENE